MTDVRDHIKDMITNLIDDNPDQARVHFHDALKLKMQGILNPQAAAAPAHVADDDAGEDDDTAIGDDDDTQDLDPPTE